MIRRKKYKTILFADISGSSALYKTEGNLEAKKIVDVLLNELRLLVSDNKGAVIKSIGDEIMNSFDNVRQCLNTAVAMQQRFGDSLQENQLKLSIGIGFGEVLVDKGDLFGEAVNDAAHLTHVAKGGQILLTESVYKELPVECRMLIREFDRIKIKGAENNTPIYRVYWQEDESQDSETRLMSTSQLVEQFKSCELHLKYQGKVYLLTEAEMPFVIGREAQQCNLLVEGSQVSREHCRIIFSRGKFVLVDHSTNGCYLSVVDNDEFYLRREEYPLIDSTSLSLGIPVADVDEEVIELYY